MASPVVAVVGRPNVGKSTFVNRIIGRREAIVEEKPGVTRDRKVLEADWNGRTFVLVDTGGWLSGDGSSLEGKVSQQSERAIATADLVLMLVDVTVGITTEDEGIADVVRRAGRPTIVIANKVDNERREPDIWEFARLGLGDPWPVSSLHGRGSGDLLDELVARLPAERGDEGADGTDTEDAAVGLVVDADAVAASIAVVGRPNVGKSTLFNRLIGDERSVVHDLPGTTRDTVDTVIETDGGRLRFVDTAGMRRKSRIDEGTEYYSLVRALQAIDTADIALLVVDATEGVTHQDQRLAERIDAAGTAVIIVLNKWELLDAEARSQLSIDVDDRLGFLGYAPTLKVSAKTGLGVHKLIPAVSEAIDAYHRRVPTRALNELISSAQSAHPAPSGRVLYATQGATDPPTFTLFTNRTLPPTYLRYLERRIREHFGFGPTPIKVRVRRRSS